MSCFSASSRCVRSSASSWAISFSAAAFWSASFAHFAEGAVAAATPSDPAALTINAIRRRPQVFISTPHKNQQLTTSSRLYRLGHHVRTRKLDFQWHSPHDMKLRFATAALALATLAAGAYAEPAN